MDADSSTSGQAESSPGREAGWSRDAAPSRSLEGDDDRAGVCLVTGCYRSGTTLLEKLLHGHPSLCFGSQPFPILYFHAKQAFLDHLGLERRYPLDHLFLERDYSRDDFLQFLLNFQVTRQRIQQLFDDLSVYTEGLWTPAVLQLRDRVQPARFPALYRQLHELLAELLDGDDARYIGSKEVLVEEYIPFILSQGGRVVLSIRDPRDMITSLDYRQRDNSTGLQRPLLYSLRAWRKSVAYLLAFRNHPGFFCSRYEDLVADPTAVLHRLAEWMGIDEFAEIEQIADQQGRVWTGNSSFADYGSISRSSVGSYRERLPAEAVRYIESCCWPEMRALGYDVDNPPLDPQELADYREPFEQLHSRFPADYSWSPERLQRESQRLRLLAGEGLSAPEANAWFLFERAYEVLRRK